MNERDAEGLMSPPWIQYPSMLRASMGWRMGEGEEYWDNFREWWLVQSLEVRAQVRRQYPEPAGWLGFYDDV